MFQILLAVGFAIVALFGNCSRRCEAWIADVEECRSDDDKFRCKSGECISNELKCNGENDCKDSSDETRKLCSTTSCSENEFKCEYGACIPDICVCDSIYDCADKSDEYPSRICVKNRVNNLEWTTDSHLAKKLYNSCSLPAYSENYTYTIQNCTHRRHTKRRKSKHTICRLQPGESVGYATAINLKCNENFYNPHGLNNFSASCENGNWIPSIMQCLRTTPAQNETILCKKLEPVNADLMCFNDNILISCDDAMIPGTKVKSHCKPKHKVKNHETIYHEMYCNDTGEWSNPLFECEAECGKEFVVLEDRIKDGKPVKYGDAPWHVAVYDSRTWILICGGTIISPKLVISAAHCFYDTITRNMSDPKYYEIVVSKFTRDHNKVDNDFQRSFKVQKIVFSDRGYYHSTTNYESDIAIVTLVKEIAFSPSVFPACIQWTNYETFNLPEGILGKVTGWGVNNLEKETVSQTLLKAEISYISYRECLRISSPDFRRYIRFDKFCAGSKTGAGVREGDSGGGILFIDEPSQLYYLRGVVSIREKGNSSIAVFTDLKEHMVWIVSEYTRVKMETFAERTSKHKRESEVMIF